MSRALRNLLLGLVAVAVAVALVLLYRQHRAEVLAESKREAPVVAPSRVTEDDGIALVTLDSAEQHRVAIAVASLHAATLRPEALLAGQVVPEPERTAVIRAPVSGRLAVADGARWPGLGERVAAGVPLAQVSDARPAASPISGTVTRVAAQPGALVEAGEPLLEVADYRHPLVRVGWTEAAGTTPVRTIVLAPGGDLRVTARLVGPAPEADPVTRRPTYLYRADRSWPGATPGTAVSALAAVGRGGTAGVLVPGSAVVQWEGLAWAYRQRAPGRFERVRVATDHAAPGGWIAGPPFAEGDTVVVRGAEELLSEEFRARVTVGDESGE